MPVDRIEPRPPSSPPPRHLPHLPLPSYRFVPGRSPHPTRHPDGHSYGAPEPVVEWSPPEDWARNEAYLRGVDLYNRAYWWEAHEAWEGFWHTTDKRATQGRFIQGLIMVAAGLLKRHVGEGAGALKLASGALERLLGVAGDPAAPSGVYMGLDILPFAEAVHRAFASITPASGRPSVVPAAIDDDWPVIRLGPGP